MNDFGLSIPQDEIPYVWDRQQEDCLHRKGITKFSDFFTRRNLLITAAFFKEMDDLISLDDPDEYAFVTFILSSLLRYTNNMTFSTSSWMDGRPVAWAKHAYWLPNQFVETNPFEYLANRLKAVKSGLKDQNSRFEGVLVRADSMEEFFNTDANYFVSCCNSSEIRLAAKSVDLVITDPPYGSNVQYGELTEFWGVWLRNIERGELISMDFSSEAVVQRRTKDETFKKDFEDYYRILLGVFKNSYRVLKDDGVLVYTFNNKNIRAWYAVLKASMDAGFNLSSEGVFFQEGIQAYRDTAHLRYDGTPVGDFVYTFRKQQGSSEREGELNFEGCLKKTNTAFLLEQIKPSFGEYLVKLYSNAVLYIIKQINDGVEVEVVENEFLSMRARRAYDELCKNLEKSSDNAA